MMNCIDKNKNRLGNPLILSPLDGVGDAVQNLKNFWLGETAGKVVNAAYKICQNVGIFVRVEVFFLRKE